MKPFKAARGHHAPPGLPACLPCLCRSTCFPCPTNNSATSQLWTLLPNVNAQIDTNTPYPTLVRPKISTWHPPLPSPPYPPLTQHVPPPPGTSHSQLLQVTRGMPLERIARGIQFLQNSQEHQHLRGVVGPDAVGESSCTVVTYGVATAVPACFSLSGRL